MSKCTYTFPCDIGDTIYVIHSETNHKLNVLHGLGNLNKVYTQQVKVLIAFSSGRTGVYAGVSGDESYKHLNLVQDFGVYWFLKKEDAEEALKARK